MIVSHPHALPAEEARDRARRLVAGLEKQLGATSSWKGDDQIDFKGKGFEGKVTLAAGQVSVDVQLGLLLRAFAGQIEKQIVERLRKEFS